MEKKSIESARNKGYQEKLELLSLSGIVKDFLLMHSFYSHY